MFLFPFLFFSPSFRPFPQNSTFLFPLPLPFLLRGRVEKDVGEGEGEGGRGGGAQLEPRPQGCAPPPGRAVPARPLFPSPHLPRRPPWGARSPPYSVGAPLPRPLLRPPAETKLGGKSPERCFAPRLAGRRLLCVV